MEKQYTEQKLTELLKSLSYISDIQVLNTEEEGYVIYSEQSKVVINLETGNVFCAGIEYQFHDNFDIGYINSETHMKYLRHNLILNLNYVKIAHACYIKGLIDGKINQPYRQWVDAEMKAKC